MKLEYLKSRREECKKMKELFSQKLNMFLESGDSCSEFCLKSRRNWLQINFEQEMRFLSVLLSDLLLE